MGVLEYEATLGCPTCDKHGVPNVVVTPSEEFPPDALANPAGAVTCWVHRCARGHLVPHEELGPRLYPS